MTGLTARPHTAFTAPEPGSCTVVVMDDPDDLYSFDLLSGIDLTLWLRLVLCLAALALGATALLAL